MFPLLSDLIAYVFGVTTVLPIPTFGFFVALAFILAYFTFLSEFKRKEAAGEIDPFERELKSRKSPSMTDYLEYGFLGFIIGFKVIGAFVFSEDFSQSPLRFIFSLKGSWFFAILLSALFLFLLNWQHRLEKATKTNKATEPNKVSIKIHPYQLMPKLVLWAAIWGFLGAKIFNYLENVQKYNNYTFSDFLQYSGLTFFGGLTFGALSFLYIGYTRGIRLIDLADIGSPGMLVAYGIGRIGCQLSGDGDWGIVNKFVKPFSWLPDWTWSSKFPHNVLNQGEYISGCTGYHCFQLISGVFPTSFYESVIILLCFSILWLNRIRIKRPGLMFCLYLLVIGIERFCIEYLRLTFKYDVFGLQLSQAQLISIFGVVLAAVIGLYVKDNKLQRIL